MTAVTQKPKTIESIPVNTVLALFAESQLASYLQEKDYIVLSETDELNTNTNVVDRLEDEGYRVIDSLNAEKLDEGNLSVSLTGSMIDTEVEDILNELHEKYGYNLSTKLRELL